MNWFYSGSNMKSVAELDALVNNVLLANDFDVVHLQHFNATCELKHLDGEDSLAKSLTFAGENGWKESSVKLYFPAECVSNASEDHAPEFEVHSIYHQSLLKVMKMAFQDISTKSFHYTPFQLFWKPTPDSASECITTKL
jgi:hypothetical protein